MGFEQFLQKSYKQALDRLQFIFKIDLFYLSRGGFWLSLGQGVAVCSSFLLSIIFARLLTKNNFGTYKYLLSTIGLLSVLSLSGIGTALTQSVARGFDTTLSFAFKKKIRYGLIGSLAALAVATYYATAHNTTFALFYFLAALLFPLWDSAQLIDSYLLGKSAFASSTILFTIQTVTMTMVLVGLAWLWPNNVLVLCAGYLVMLTLQEVLPYLYFSKRIKLDAKIDEGVMQYGKHLSLMSVLSVIADRIDTIAVFHFLSATDLAIYTFAIAPPEQLKALFKNILPLSQNKFTLRSLDEIHEDIWRKMLYLFILILGVIFIYILAAPFLYSFLFPTYEGATHLSQLFALSLMGAVTTPLIGALQAHKKLQQLYHINIFGSLLLVICLTIGIKGWGLTGAVIGQVVYRLVFAAFTIWQFQGTRE